LTKLLEIYKCEVCGNIVEVLHTGAGELVCCGKPMVLQEEKTADKTTEKHVPVIEKIDGGYKVKVGNIPHPMMEKHLIEWVQLLAGDKAYRTFLRPETAPEAIFLTDEKEATAREYCNLHGLWKGD